MFFVLVKSFHKKEKNCLNTLSYNTTDNIRFMPNSLSSLAEKLAKELHKVKCKEYKSDQEYMAVNNVSLIFKCIYYIY